MLMTFQLLQDRRRPGVRGHRPPHEYSHRRQNLRQPRPSANQFPHFDTSAMNSQAPSNRPAELNWQQQQSRGSYVPDTTHRRPLPDRHTQRAEARQRNAEGKPVQLSKTAAVAAKCQGQQGEEDLKDGVDHPTCVICTETLKVSAQNMYSAAFTFKSQCRGAFIRAS